MTHQQTKIVQKHLNDNKDENKNTSVEQHLHMSFDEIFPQYIVNILVFYL